MVFDRVASSIWEHLSLSSSNLESILIKLFALESWKKRLILLSFDSLVIPLSILLALAARLENHDFLTQIDSYIACAVSLACSMTLFYARGFYKAFTRHITVDTAISIIAAAAVSAVVLLTLITFAGLQIPRSVPFIHAAFSIVSIASLRFFIRAIGQNIDRDVRKNIAIYGAGMAGRQLVEVLQLAPAFCSLLVFQIPFSQLSLYRVQLCKELSLAFV